MGKIILARENDKGSGSATLISWITIAFIGGFGGLPFGAILSAIMQRVLDDSSALIMYGFFAAPIILGMLISLLYSRNNMDAKNHTVCPKCRCKMIPSTQTDSLFYIPAQYDHKYEDPFHYLAQNMHRIYTIGEIPPHHRGCYVCCYLCEKCGQRIVRIADFLPQTGDCHWKETYYYDYWKFIEARQKDDLL